ncbi:MAG: hypothetical protein C0506_11020 [Anaerolinea sp.]|nr:hypothetical protein [Anaerolinea sp.]
MFEATSLEVTLPTPIGVLAVRRSILIAAPPERVWAEFTTFERMKRWFGVGHKLVAYEPRVGGIVETDASGVPEGHEGEALRFRGRVVTFEPNHEVTFEQDWLGHGWVAPPYVTIRLTPALGGTLVELFHHTIERVGPSAAEDHAGFEGGWDTRHLLALRTIVEA